MRIVLTKDQLHLAKTTYLGFSYAEKEPGSLNPLTGVFEDADFAGVQGRYPVINATLLGGYYCSRRREQ